MNYLMKIFIILIIIFILLHIPRLLIEFRSRTNIQNNDHHGEDCYQKSRNGNNIASQKRILSWTQFEMSKQEWDEYRENLIIKLLKLYRDEFNTVPCFTWLQDDDLVSIRPNNEVISYISSGDIVETWIDEESQLIRTCFNHEWCSGSFFLKYGACIFNGETIHLMAFPNTPIIPELCFIKMLIMKPHEPISRCFEPNLPVDCIKRISFNIDLTCKQPGIASRTVILWNVLDILNKIHKKDYNILIPVPFASLKNIWNNIGVIFVKWKSTGTTIEKLETEINTNKYNAVATNLYLRSNTDSSIGKKTRQNVDLVFSSGYVKNATIMPKYTNATFTHTADYGIYCLTTTIKNRAMVSLTFNTDNFDFDNLLPYLDSKKIEYMLF